MKKLLLVFCILLLASNIYAQKYMSKNGHVEFLSKTPMETIEGENNQVASTLTVSTGEIAFTILIKSFEFKQALLQEQFNKNYMESDKYPRSTFKGKITKISSVNFQKDGQYPVIVEGQLTMHNVTKDIKTTGNISISGKKINAISKFTISPSDYGILIPSLVMDKIAKQIEIRIGIPYELLN